MKTLMFTLFFRETSEFTFLISSFVLAMKETKILTVFDAAKVSVIILFPFKRATTIKYDSKYRRPYSF